VAFVLYVRQRVYIVENEDDEDQKNEAENVDDEGGGAGGGIEDGAEVWLWYLSST
jgi:hypothetical protein